MKKEPRKHQLEAIGKLMASIQAGHKRPIVMAPTGFGKTVLAAMIIEAAIKIGWRICFIVPRISLIDQTVAAFGSEGINDVGVIQACHYLTDYSKPVQVATFQSLVRRMDKSKEFTGLIKTDALTFDLIIWDECHILSHAILEWMALPDIADTQFVGLSATPWTKGLGNHWDDLIIAETTQGLIEKGYLSPFRVFAVDHPDLSGVKTVAGDYHEGQLAILMAEKRLLGSVVENWLKNGENRPTLCFCVDCAHAQKLAAEFTAAGVSCGYQDAHTPDDERQSIKERFASGAYRVVCSVGTLTTGVDWDVRCIVLARPTKSEILYVQMIGRGLRTAQGKNDCLIFDHSDNASRLGFVTDIYYSELDNGMGNIAQQQKEKKKKLPKECPKCKFLKPVGVHECPSCGFAPVQQSPIKETGDELQEITPKKLYSVDEKQRFYSEVLGYTHQHGKNPKMALALYKQKFGVWPRGIDESRSLTPSPEVLNYIKSRNIAYAKQMAKHANTARN